MHESQIDNFIDTSAVEVGLFLQNLTSYVLEKGIDISYTSCFNRNWNEWKNIGLKHAKYRPIMLASLGYAEKYRFEEEADTEYWKKPEYEEMIEWV